MHELIAQPKMLLVVIVYLLALVGTGAYFAKKAAVKKEGKEINLTKKEYDTLLLFARNPGNVLFREIIYERVWGGDYIAGSRTVDLHVQRVRKKVGWEDFLITVPKMGYRLEVPR